MVLKGNVPWNKGKKGLQHSLYKKDIPKDLLNKLYIEDKLSSRQIAKIFKVNKITILNRLREYNIFIRDKFEGERIRILQKGFKGGNWKGGKLIHKNGYIDIWVYPNNSFYSMAKNLKKNNQGGYVREHRLVMAKFLNRPLESWEQVHHINGKKQDNRIKNLKIIDNVEHSCFHRQIFLLKEEIKKLKALLLLILISRKEIKL